MEEELRYLNNDRKKSEERKEGPLKEWIACMYLTSDKKSITHGILGVLMALIRRV